jgi:phage-related baseplate assembly protein
LGILFSGEPDPALPWLEPLGVGRDVVRMQVIEVVMSVDGVYNLDLISPPQDLGIAPYEFPVSGAVTLTFGGPVDG